MKNQGRIILGILLIILIAIFALLNVETVPVDFGFAEVHWPLVMVLLISLLIGALLVFLFSSINTFKTNRQRKTSEQDANAQIDSLQKQNNQLTQQLKNSVGKQDSGQKDQQIKQLQQQVADLKKKVQTS
ncbi:LapA family protein [Levilactobacillus bambusae]|uniref:DUF1049 domain-containing protein n=1 Tax=Levilactobacillus bambusae TaxID=2024736 RepID=A0A2V1N3R9_9LACO|nr:LapA family protein [Levilactobacillus bambusae]PWG00696.1 DUF1049 domain-containing protein [Levilactobacillus bambusae]